MGPSLLEEIVAHSCLNEVSEKPLYRREPTVLSYYVSENFPATPDHITAQAKVQGGPVLLRLIISPHIIFE